LQSRGTKFADDAELEPNAGKGIAEVRTEPKSVILRET